MSKSFLSRMLYRRHGEIAELPDAASLAAIVADGPVSAAQRSRARVAESAQNADLYRFARDLHPLSVKLAEDLRAQFDDAEIAAQDRRWRRAPHSRQPRRARIAIAALAASLVVAAALWVRHDHAVPPRAAASHPAAREQVPDRIFAGLNDRAVATSNSRRGDEIFRSNFRRVESPGARRHDG